MKDESKKVGLNLNIQKTKIMASSPIISQQIDGETGETVRDFILDTQVEASHQALPLSARTLRPRSLSS